MVLEGCSISAVVPEDLTFFTRLTHLDLGDNRVPFESLAYLPALQATTARLLRLCRRCASPLTYIYVAPASCRHASLRLGKQELHIDCNGLQHLSVPAGGFPKLEVLNVSYNGLSSQAMQLLLEGNSNTTPACRRAALAMAAARTARAAGAARGRGEVEGGHLPSLAPLLRHLFCMLDLS